ncbi:MAG TPA: DUF1214 domain-containing protein [Stellaceae bacterium]|nr:DUF1214 domain-containing protein [Stellaceae bacterium]
MSSDSSLEQDWRDIAERFLGCGAELAPLLLSPGDPAQRADACQTIMSLLGCGYLNAFLTDPYHPRFTPIFNEGSNGAAPNGDTVYGYASLADDGVYRIAGNRGTSRQCVLVLGSALFTMTDTLERMNDHIDIDDIPRSADGEFEFILSARRPDGYAGHWEALPPRAGAVVVRHIACDWLREQDAVLTIECLNRPVQLPRASVQEIMRRFDLVAPYPRRYVTPWQRWLLDMRAKGIVNRLRLNAMEETGGGLIHQAYYEGLFEVDADEVLILQTEIPQRAFYWSVLLTDELYRTIGYMDRQSTLNDVQARLDADGRFRAVISATDPGVPNWLDTGGYTSGSIQGRWNKCSGSPLPEIKRVALADLRRHLPPDTPHVTPAEREAILRQRLRGGQRRRRW